MSYASISRMTGDFQLRQRIIACAALEGEQYPEQWVEEKRWNWATSPGWPEAYDYAITANPSPDYIPGADEAVITDGMILAAVQAIRSTL